MQKTKLIEGFFSDAIEDAGGDRYLAFGPSGKRCWVAQADLHHLDTKLVKRLARSGTVVIATRQKEALKQAAQRVTDFRKVGVANGAGWADGTYAFRDATLVTLKGSRSETVITFEPDGRFALSSDLSEWQMAIGPFVRHQPLVLFGLCFGLVGPLLRFVPPDVQNPVVEFVGEKEKGKSSLAKAMSSMWGGDDRALLGVCDDWDHSNAKLDELRLRFKDSLLVLDETNRAAKTESEKAEIVSSAIFKLADTSSRKRFGEENPPQIRQAVLSTSNSPIHSLSQMKKQDRDAMLSRILSLEVNRPFGIFDVVPDGFPDARSAVEGLNVASTSNHGSPSHAFLEGLSKHSEKKIKRVVAEYFVLAKQRGILSLVDGARISKTVALAYVAGKIAMEFGIFPKAWGNLEQAFFEIFGQREKRVSAERADSAFEKIHAYIAANKQNLISIGSRQLPLTPRAFQRMPGVWLKRDRQIVISTRFLQQKVPDCITMLKSLRSEGRLDHDAGQLTKKCPRGITSKGRAHFIDVERPTEGKRS